MAGHNKAAHYKLVAHKDARGEGVGPDHKGVTTPSSAPSGKVIYRDSRCPGCHGRVTLKYRVERVDGSFRYHLLSPPIAHTACEGALEDIRKANPAWFRREIRSDATIKVQPSSPLFRRAKSSR